MACCTDCKLRVDYVLVLFLEMNFLQVHYCTSKKAGSLETSLFLLGSLFFVPAPSGYLGYPLIFSPKLPGQTGRGAGGGSSDLDTFWQPAQGSGQATALHDGFLH